MIHGHLRASHAYSHARYHPIRGNVHQSHIRSVCAISPCRYDIMQQDVIGILTSFFLFVCHPLLTQTSIALSPNKSVAYFTTQLAEVKVIGGPMDGGAN